MAHWHVCKCRESTGRIKGTGWNQGDRFLNESSEFIQKPVPLIPIALDKSLTLGNLRARSHCPRLIAIFGSRDL
jgi:hypothetical protein